MKFKSLLFAGALSFACLSMASAKSYSVTLSQAATAGTVQLAAGNYKVKVDGSNAIFTNLDSGKSVTTPVKVENTGKKHDLTAVDTSNGNGSTKLDAIELGGTDETLEFGE